MEAAGATQTAKKIISDAGKQLAAQKNCPKKDPLIKLLKQVAGTLAELNQLESLRSSIKPLSDSFVKHNLFQHTDKDVRLLVAVCTCHIIRVLAPNPGFADANFKDIFKLFIGLFAELVDTTSTFFEWRLRVLENVAQLKFCYLMLDTGCEDLVLKMFHTFFNVVREEHPQTLYNAMSAIAVVVLKEKVSRRLADLVLQSLLKEGKGASPAAYRLAVSIMQNCSEEFEAYVCEFLISCIVNGDAVGSAIKEFYHEIIFEIFQCAPRILLAVIPTLTQELLADQVDVRIKAMRLVGRLLTLPGRHVAHEYPQLFIEFLKRFSDKSAEVRLGAISCLKAFHLCSSSGSESLEVLSALEDRLLDSDDRVRSEAVVVACDLSRANLKSFPRELISKLTDRLRDKKVSVRKKAMQKLLEVYRDYCTKCSGGVLTPNTHFEQIPCKILMLCYHKDCKEFRPQTMDLVLADELFPDFLSIEERTKHWISLFSLFDSLHLKALNSILCQKQRLQTEMQVYLGLLEKEEGNGCEELLKRIQTSVAKMSATFPDSSKAEECFHSLNLAKDKSILPTLAPLLNEMTIKVARELRDNILGRIGEKHPQIGFLRLLCTKSMFNVFGSDHLECIIEHLLSDNLESDNLVQSAVKLLLAIINVHPSLLRGSEEQFKILLLNDKLPFNEELIQILAKAGRSFGIKLSDIFPLLKRVCLEGTRSQSKLAVSAIAALIETTEKSLLSELCENLVEALHAGQNIPTVLQSLGCTAQHFVSVFESRYAKIAEYMVKNVFQPTHVQARGGLDSSVDTSECSFSCKLKIFGLKALVKSFLPRQGTRVGRDVNQLLDILVQILQIGCVSGGKGSCDSDKDIFKLASAKSVLRLARRWDFQFPPQVFVSTMFMAKDLSAATCRLFIGKIHKLLQKHALPSKYACGFAFAASSSLTEVRDESLKYMADFIRNRSREAEMSKNSTNNLGVTEHPAYIVVFLIHVLAHGSGFPPEIAEDGVTDNQFFGPLVFTLEALVNVSFVDGDMNIISAAISSLRSIFFAIKKADDAVAACATPKLHILADYGLGVLNRLSIPASRSPHVVLLPSSLYRSTSVEKNPETSNTLIKRDKKLRGNFWQSDLKKCSTFRPSLLKKDDGLVNAIEEQNDSSLLHETESHRQPNQETGTRRRQDCSSRSVELHAEFSIDDVQEKDTSGYAEPLIDREQFPSSSGSVDAIPSLNQTEVLESPREVNGVNTESDGIDYELPKLSMSGCCSLQEPRSFDSRNCDLSSSQATGQDVARDNIFQGNRHPSKGKNSLTKRKFYPSGKENEKKLLVHSSSEATCVTEEPIARRTRRWK